MDDLTFGAAAQQNKKSGLDRLAGKMYTERQS
jgi:hypothetical protein